MGFEEAFVFVLAGFVVIYHQRSRQDSVSQKQIILLWSLVVVLPILAIAWTTLNQTALPLALVVTSFLFGTWIYHSTVNGSNKNKVTNLSPIEEKKLKECFSPNIYHLKDLECRPQEIYCRGSLRSQNYKYAYETISQNIQKVFGDRFFCTLQESPIENSGKSFGTIPNDRDDQQNITNYCFYVIPSQNTPPFPKSRSLRLDWFLSITSMIYTAITVLFAGAKIYHFENPNSYNLQSGIPYLFGIASIFTVRAIAQYYIALKYKLPLTPPILIPCIGGFGLLSSLNINAKTDQSPTTKRHILFDLAVTPSIAGLVISMILLILGNWLLIPPVTFNPAIATSPLLPNLETFNFKTSLFVTLLQTIFSIGKTTIASSTASETIQTLSPLTLAGWTGLALSALQLLPFRFLDGGNLAIAMFGHRQVVHIARITRLVLLAIAFLVQPWLRIYSLLLFLLPTPSPLVLNESIEIDKPRDLIGIGLMAIALLIILPMPKSFL